MSIPESLDVQVSIGERAVKLFHLRKLTDRLQRALRALASELAGSAAPGVEFEIVKASVGSLTLGLRAVAEEASLVQPQLVLATFALDLAQIHEQSYRPDLTSGLTRHYRALVTCLSEEAAIVEYRYGSRRVVVDQDFRQRFEIALRERVAEDVSVVGFLDAVNVHKVPFTFYLYPKLEGADRIECRFPAEMLQVVAGFLNKTVKVEGTGYFAPVGIYPLRMELRQAPAMLSWDPALLRAYVGKLSLVPKGLAVDEYVQRNREESGFEE